MKKSMIFAFCLIIVTVLVLLYNMKGFLTPPKTDIHLVFMTIRGVYTSVALLSFTVVGVLIGLCLK